MSPGIPLRLRVYGTRQIGDIGKKDEQYRNTPKDIEVLYAFISGNRSERGGLAGHGYDIKRVPINRYKSGYLFSY